MHGSRLLLAASMVVAMIAVGTQSAGADRGHRATIVASRGSLTDLSSTTVDPTDGAYGGAIAVAGRGHTRVMMLLLGLDRTAAGKIHGAHVHVGPCVAGNGAAAGPHYNTTGGAIIDPTTEVWLDFTITSSGLGFATAEVPFVIPPGAAGSIVVHASPTAPNGTAGARLACLPMKF